MQTIFIGNAAAVKKAVVVGFASQSVLNSYSGKEVEIGLGSRTVSVDSWVPADVIAAWNNSEDSLLTTVLASLPETTLGLVGAVLFTETTAGRDFRLSILVDGETPLVSSSIQYLSFSGSVGSGTFTLTVNGQTTGNITWDNNTATLATSIQTAVNALSTIDTGDCVVTYVSGNYIFNFSGGAFAGLDMPAISADVSSLDTTNVTVSVTTTQQGSVAQNEKQTIQFNIASEFETSNEKQKLSAGSPAPSTGTFKLNLTGVTSDWTADIAYNTNAANVASKLSSVGLDNTEVTVSGGPLPGTPIVLDFIGSLAGTDIPMLTINNSGLAIPGATPEITITEKVKGVAPGAGTNAKHNISIPASATGGTFTLSYTEGKTSATAYDASKTTLDTNIEAKTGAGTVTITGTSLSSGYVIEYTGSKAAQAVALPTADGSGLTNGVSVNVEVVSEPTFISSEWGTIQLIGDARIGMSGRTITLGPRNYSEVGGTTPAITDGAICTLTFRNTYRSASETTLPTTFSVDIPYKAKLSEVFDLIKAAEDAFIAANLPEFDEAVVYGRYTPATPLTTYVTPRAETTPIMYGEQLWCRDADSTRAAPLAITSLGFNINFASIYLVQSLAAMSDWINPGGAVAGFNSITGPTAKTNVWGYKPQGTFKLGYGGEWTPNFTIGATGFVSPNDMQAALEDLSTIGEGNIEMRGGFSNTGHIDAAGTSGSIEYRFIGDKASTAMGPILLDYDGLEINIYNGSSTTTRDATADDFATIRHSLGGLANAPTVHSLEFLPSPPATGEITYSMPGYAGTAIAAYNSSNATLKAQLETLLGAGTVTISGGPLATGLTTVAYDSKLGISDLLVADYAAKLNVTISNNTSGVAPGVGINEQQIVTVKNATAGTFTLSPESGTPTSDIPINASAAAVRLALEAAQGSADFSVSGVSGGPWTITFINVQEETDVDMLTADDSDLVGSSTPRSYIATEESKGGIVTYTGGLTGGDYTVQIEYGNEKWFVQKVPFDTDTNTISDMFEETLGFGVTATGGPHPSEPITIEFDDGEFESKNLPLMKIIPNLVVEDVANPTVTKLVEAQRADSNNNIWELTVVPGEGTPGLKVGETSWWKVGLVLKITTPTGTISLPTPVSAADMNPEGDDVEANDQVAKAMVNEVMVNFATLSAERLEQVINEAFLKDVVRVTRVVHSLEWADIQGTAYDSTVIKVQGYYYRDVYRIVFVNDYADDGTITNIEVYPAQRPKDETHTETWSGNTTYPSQTITPEDFMSFGSREGLPTQDATPTVTSDFISEPTRISYLFWMAYVLNQPIHEFAITRITAVAESKLTYCFKLQKQYVNNSAGTAAQVDTIGLAELPPDLKIRFSWASRVWADNSTNQVTYTDTIIATTPFMNWNIDPGTIKAEIEKLITLSGVAHFPGIGNVEVSGSLMNSWLSDPYQPGQPLPDEDESWGNNYHDLKVSLIGKLLGQPFNEFGLVLIMQVCHGYEWSGTNYGMADTKILTASKPTFGTGGISATQQYSKFRTPTVHSDIYSACLPPYINERVRVQSDSDSVTMVVGGQSITVDTDTTGAELQTLLVSKLGGSEVENYGLLGKLWYIANVDSTSPVEYRGKQYSIPLQPHFNFCPLQWRRSASVYGVSIRDGVEIEWTGYSYQYTDTLTLSVSNADGVSDYMEVIPVQDGKAAQSWKVTFTMTGTPTSGDITFTRDGTDFTMDTFSKAAFVTAFSGESDYVGATGGPLPTTPVVLEFDPASSFDAITVESNDLTGSVAAYTVTQNTYGGLDGNITIRELVAGNGPSWWNSKKNWNGRVPSSGDAVMVDDAVAPILYGIDQQATCIAVSLDGKVFSKDRVNHFVVGQKVWVSGDTPTGITSGSYKWIFSVGNDGTFYLGAAADSSSAVTFTSIGGEFNVQVRALTVDIYARYAGDKIGLANRRDASNLEYLPRYVAAGIDTLKIGVGEGDGLSLARFDTLQADAEIDVYLNAASDIPNAPAILLLTDSEDSTLNVHSGATVGLGAFVGETSTLGTVNVYAGGEFMSKRNEAGVTIGLINQATGGTVVHFGDNVILN